MLLVQLHGMCVNFINVLFIDGTNMGGDDAIAVSIDMSSGTGVIMWI